MDLLRGRDNETSRSASAVCGGVRRRRLFLLLPSVMVARENSLVQFAHGWGTCWPVARTWGRCDDPHEAGSRSGSDGAAHATVFADSRSQADSFEPLAAPVVPHM